MAIGQPSPTRIDHSPGKKQLVLLVKKFLYQHMYTGLGKQMKFKASSHDLVIPAAHMKWKSPCNLNEREKEEKRLVGMVMIEAVPDDQPPTCCTNSVKAHKVDNPETILHTSDVKSFK